MLGTKTKRATHSNLHQMATDMNVNVPCAASAEQTRHVHRATMRAHSSLRRTGLVPRPEQCCNQKHQLGTLFRSATEGRATLQDWSRNCVKFVQKPSTVAVTTHHAVRKTVVPTLSHCARSLHLGRISVGNLRGKPKYV